jgi:hypothetical protein
VGVDLAGDVALEAAQDVELGQALVGPPLDISPGRRVAVHTVKWVQIDIAEAAEDLDHLITPEERLKIAMTRQ